MERTKITAQKALKIIEKHFRVEVTNIYREIDEFRGGRKNLEVLGDSPFHQILRFLVLKSDPSLSKLAP